jgi:hypothetical protein
MGRDHTLPYGRAILALSMAVASSFACGRITGIDDLANVDANGSAHVDSGTGSGTPLDGAGAQDGGYTDGAALGFCGEHSGSPYCNDFEAADSVSSKYVASVGRGGAMADSSQAHTGLHSMRLETDASGFTIATLVLPGGNVELSGGLTLSFWWERLDENSFVVAKMRTESESINYECSMTGSRAELYDLSGAVRSHLSTIPDEPPAGRFIHVELSVRKTGPASGVRKVTAAVSVALDGIPMPASTDQVLDSTFTSFAISIAGNPLGGKIWIDDTVIDTQ